MNFRTRKSIAKFLPKLRIINTEFDFLLLFFSYIEKNNPILNLGFIQEYRETFLLERVNEYDDESVRF